MTTITIDTELNLSKTRFSNGIEAAYFLMWAQINEFDDDIFWTKENSKNIQAYKDSILQKNKIFTLSEAKKLLLWNTK